MKRIISKYKFYIFALIIAFIALLFTSKNSFIYVFNDWVDANAFFTVGKSMFNGVVPYKDLFEQKGLYLYLIYGIGYLFSRTSFHGVFILEVISFSVFLYYMHKIFKIYFNEKYSYVLLPIMAYIITTCTSFVHGGSCEEFALPYMAISLYYFIRHFKEKPLTKKEIIINGIMAGLVLMMKYTLLGLWIGFGMFMALDYLRKKKIKEAFLFCMLFLVGMAIPFTIGLIYFLINHGVKAFIKDYFIINMTTYGHSKIGIITRLKVMIKGISKLLRVNGKIISGLICFQPLLLLGIRDKENYLKISLIGIMFLTIFFITWGLVFYLYYLLPVIIFTAFSIIGIVSFLSKYVDKYLNNKLIIIPIVLVIIGSIILCYSRANYKEYRSYSKNHFFQYKYANYINSFKDPTLLNMGALDAGLYTTSGIIPNTKFFEVQNINYESFPDNIDEMEKNVKNKDVKFILYYTRHGIDSVPSYIYDNYKLVFNDLYKFEGRKFNALLFQLKEL